MKSKNDCIGCKDDFYNGKNPYNIKECWRFKDAKFVKRKRVNINQRPPWNQKPVKVLNCYKEKNYVYIDLEVTK